MPTRRARAPRVPALAGAAALRALVALLALAGGCSRSSLTDAAALAGTYELRAVDGRAVPVDALGGAVSGTLVLTPDGRVLRLVRYATSGIPGPVEQRAFGTFQARGAEVSLRLVAAGSPAGTPPLQAEGEVRQRTLLLRWPAPGAGGGVEERYERREP